MKFMLLASAVIIFLFSSASRVWSEDGIAEFNGEVQAATCKINGEYTSEPSFLVKLGNFPAGAFRQVGGTPTMTKKYQIKLTDCTPEFGRVTVYFEPGATTDPEDGDLINTGTARNVELVLMNDDFTKINLAGGRGAQNSKQFNIVNGSAVLTYFAGYVATSLPVVAGSFSTSTTYVLDFE
ncbi:fimbrial protein [Burkholderia metallica]|uniref:fimbrial protein n=1 Tax=Burkholderia metallica TaxID=488729 RepID=UPI00157B5A9C|nr:fimbrial protein [Burkholderia metallica]